MSNQKQRGRPTKYNPKFHPKLAKALARTGMVDDQIADEMEINRDTLYDWKKKYPIFSDALKEGKEDPDDQVEASLFKSAKGYETIVEREVMGKDGKIQKVKETQIIPGNVTAQIYWLKNRRRDKWRDKYEMDVSGSINLITDSDDADV